MTQPQTRGRRTRPSADQTRDAILAAALEVFSEQGYDGSSTREIAERAGVTQPLLNYHFNSKEQLWRTAVDRVFLPMAQSLGERARGLRGVDDLTTARLLVREFVLFSARNPQLHRILTQECKVDTPRMDWLVEQHVRPLYEAAIELFRRLADTGQVPDIAPEHLYYVVTGAGPTMFVLAPEARRLTGLDPSSEAVIEAHADAMCLLLFGRELA